MRSRSAASTAAPSYRALSMRVASASRPTCQRRRALAAGREVEGEAVERVAQEIERRVLAVEDVHLHRRELGALAAQQLADGSEAAVRGVELDGRAIGGEHLPALGRHA